MNIPGPSKLHGIVIINTDITTLNIAKVCQTTLLGLTNETPKLLPFSNHMFNVILDQVMVERPGNRPGTMRNTSSERTTARSTVSLVYSGI